MLPSSIWGAGLLTGATAGTCGRRAALVERQGPVFAWKTGPWHPGGCVSTHPRRRDREFHAVWSLVHGVGSESTYPVSWGITASESGSHPGPYVPKSNRVTGSALELVGQSTGAPPSALGFRSLSSWPGRRLLIGSLRGTDIVEREHHLRPYVPKPGQDASSRSIEAPRTGFPKGRWERSPVGLCRGWTQPPQ
jgi:hypothetical protein